MAGDSHRCVKVPVSVKQCWISEVYIILAYQENTPPVLHLWVFHTHLIYYLEIQKKMRVEVRVECGIVDCVILTI